MLIGRCHCISRTKKKIKSRNIKEDNKKTDHNYVKRFQPKKQEHLFLR